jgi:hypothetical protein
MSTRTITLPADQWEAILEAVQDQWDEGPPGEGWQGSRLSAASAALSTALAQPEPSARLRYCDVHGQQPANAWGCPECVREMRQQLAQPEPEVVGDEGIPQWSEGVCGDGAAILRDGVMMPIEEVVASLNRAEILTRYALAQPEPVGGGLSDEELPPRVGHILRLAEIIREVDGSHDKGAAALAEAILSHSGSRWSPAIEPVPEGPPLEPRGCPTPGACPTAATLPPEMIRALELAEAALADIGDADREPGDDLAWAEVRAAQDLPRIRRALTRYARPTIEPVPVSERPWKREKGWNDPDGECWWCPPDGPPYWQMANPAMVYGGWLLPVHALPIPTPEGCQTGTHPV